MKKKIKKNFLKQFFVKIKKKIFFLKLKKFFFSQKIKKISKKMQGSFYKYKKHYYYVLSVGKSKIERVVVEDISYDKDNIDINLISYVQLYDSEEYPFGTIWVRDEKTFKKNFTDFPKILIDNETIRRFCTWNYLYIHNIH